jgi:hypothetical protein
MRLNQTVPLAPFDLSTPMGEGFGWLNIQRYWFSIKAFPAGGEGEPPPKAVVDEVVPNVPPARLKLSTLLNPTFQKFPRKNSHRQPCIEPPKGTILPLSLPRRKDKQEEREMFIMSNSNKSNKLVVPEARQAMDKFKMEAASEVGVDLGKGYNGNLTTKQAGSIGGQMVKKMIEAYENGMQ